LAEDGSFKVTQEITFDKVPDQVKFELAMRRETFNSSYYKFIYSDISASAGKLELDPKVSLADFGGLKVATDVVIDTSKVTGDKVKVDYTVRGAVIAGPQGNPTLDWAILQGMTFPVNRVEGVINGPTLAVSIDCVAGPADLKCGSFSAGTHSSINPIFSDGPRKPGEDVRIKVTYPVGAVALSEKFGYFWTLDRAFTTDWSTIFTSLALLALGAAGLLLLHRRYGADAVLAKPIPVAEFIPVNEGRSVFRVLDDIRPGHIGTLADERVDPVDVTGTILDLAIRGHLRLHELKTPKHANLDWRFELLENDDDELRPFEEKLLAAICSEGEECKVSTLAEHVAPAIGEVQDELYEEVVERRWFDTRPDDTRSFWGRLGWGVLAAAVAVTALLVLFTKWGLVGLSLIALALGLVWASERMPRRTVLGTSVLSGLNVLSGMLFTYPTDQMPEDRTYEELSKVLPYAVVLGGKKRWLEAIADADKNPDIPDPTDLYWYHAPDDWHLA
ncbi:MAG: hypothetical protein CR979_02810, partial [Propionibacterium sp.]